MKLKNLFLALAALSGFFIAGNAQATCSNYATYADGQVLTASSLNSLQTNYTNCVNAVLDGDTFTGNMVWHSGSDILMYSDAGSTLKAAIYGDGAGAILPLKIPGKLINLNITNATTTNANDSIKIECGNSTCSATNPGFIVLNSAATPGDVTVFTVTSDVTINLTWAHWGVGTKGDITDAIHRVYAVDHNGSLGWCVGYQGGFEYFATTQDSATATDINLPEEVLCNIAITSASNTATEVAWYRVNFDDTGGAAEDLWAVQTGVGDLNNNQTADGVWQPWSIQYSAGWSVVPSGGVAVWTQYGKTINVIENRSSGGTSNATSATIVLPIKAKTGHDLYICKVSDNSAVQTSPGLLQLTASSTSMSGFKTIAGGTFTASGAKKLDYNITYEMYQP